MGQPTSWFTIFILTTTIILVILSLLFAPKIIAPDNGFGAYGTPRTGDCIDGMQTNVQECIPNINTGRGCWDDRGFQSFTPKITKVMCVPQSQSSVWETTTGPCVDVNPNPLTPVFEQTVTLKCISKGDKGVNGCVLTQRLETGVIGLVPYPVGSVVQTQQQCTPLTR
jgi:hypothetical protein